MKLWDVRKEKGPFKVIKFHEHLIPKLCDLYENDAIFDKFECSWSSNSSQLLTGSYNNTFYVCDAFGDKKQAMRVRSGVLAIEAPRETKKLTATLPFRLWNLNKLNALQTHKNP